MTAEINGSRHAVWQGAIDSKEWLVKQSEDGCRHAEESSNGLREFPDAAPLRLTVRRREMTLGTILLIILVYAADRCQSRPRWW